MANLLWGQLNLVNTPSQGPLHTKFPQQYYMGIPLAFSMQPQPTYGPTGIPMPHQYYYYLYPNQQLPFLSTLDLPGLSRLMNNPIFHASHWPSIISK